MKIDEATVLPLDTAISFDMKNGISGTGLIKGIATNGVPILGKSYIVEISTSVGIDEKTYPYTHMTVFELFMEKI